MRENFPERVPFRLTRMIVNALDTGTVEGIFRKSCEDVMWVLRDSRASLVALLEIFVHEPLDEVDAGGKPGSSTKVLDRVGHKLGGNSEILDRDEQGGKPELGRMIIERVGQKLVGKDELIEVYLERRSALDIETQVDALIKESSDPSNYVMHYAGWCPFW
jgi:phosphatidylinositol kinase/protein kinase (PI-3  family)